MTDDGETMVSEAEIDATVALFYGRARDDGLLGPIFRGAVPDAQWNGHLAKIAAFWRKVLRRQPGYEGNPMRAHVALGVLERRHFERWLALFEAAAREVCRPEAAEVFVERARLIAASLIHGLEFFRAREQTTGNALQLSQFTDYALRALILVALNGERRTTVEEIATRYGVSRDHVRKVVQQLTRLGFLAATRGRGGGVRLGMPADRIRIGDVVRGTENGFGLAECLRPDCVGVCPIDGVCRLTGILRAAARAFLAELDRHTLADVVANRAALLARLTTAA